MAQKLSTISVPNERFASSLRFSTWQHYSGIVVQRVVDIRRTMELSADAVAAELRDHRQLPLLGVFPNGRADGVERNVGPASGQTHEQTLLRNGVQVPGMKQLISCRSLCDT